jgi:hypothetical protein
MYNIESAADEIPQAMAKLAGYHSPTSRECTEVEYASPEWEWAMVEEPGTPSTRKRAHEKAMPGNSISQEQNAGL